MRLATKLKRLDILASITHEDALCTLPKLFPRDFKFNNAGLPKLKRGSISLSVDLQIFFGLSGPQMGSIFYDESLSLVIRINKVKTEIIESAKQNGSYSELIK